MAGRKPNKKGRDEKLPSFTPMLHHVMDCPAFLTLTPLAECIYWWLVRLSGVGGCHNGNVFLSVRQVAKRYRVGKDTASAAFHLLQARGFIRPRDVGRLGIEGEGKATTWVLTQWKAQNGHAATKDFLAWKPGQDFPVKKGRPPVHAEKPVPNHGHPVPIQGRKEAKDAA
jgi:DNA-binding transcriptional MocR family regulator